MKPQHLTHVYDKPPLSQQSRKKIKGAAIPGLKVFLLSGGLDSISCLYLASKPNSQTGAPINQSSEGKNIGVYIDYGQKAARQEEIISRYHARQLKLKFIKLKTGLFSKYGSSSLTHKCFQIPQGHDLDIENLKTSLLSAKRVWVPNRNGVFLNLAAFYAESQGVNQVVIGFNKEEAATFPDNSEAFLKKATEFFSFSTANKVQVISPTLLLEKFEIVQRVKDLFDLSKIWPCYLGGDEWCGECESCLRCRRAFEKNGLNWERLKNENKTFIRKISLHWG